MIDTPVSKESAQIKEPIQTISLVEDFENETKGKNQMLYSYKLN